jgi:hypothetical protein
MRAGAQAPRRLVERACAQFGRESLKSPLVGVTCPRIVDQANHENCSLVVADVHVGLLDGACGNPI